MIVEANYGGMEVSEPSLKGLEDEHRRFRILCVVDDFSRECLAAVVDTSLSGVGVVRELVRLTLEAWRHDYNWFRPHSSLDALTPREFADQPS